MVNTTPFTTTSLKAEFHEYGWRLTSQRQTILEVFQNLPQGNHLSAEALDEILQNKGQDISLSTIYRTLKLMARIGILRELELSEGHKLYELNQPHPHHHHHLVCVFCHNTIEFKSNPTLQVGYKTAQKQGFHLLDCQLTIHAICPACQKGGGERERIKDEG
ncbi:transcriptional repressor [Kovacikia minuta CCNUW1]|uniref:Fur family transcriptional regulator n=1 Tax=Kovacikia minuta TaxID=2931930 RepID=UPI001CCB79F5|nr:Fur family transcriptional regulator [Kovacikia minuta]UBF28488.1 transcriptional repressor [Kovacikia minuta CCNUW1]